MLFMWSRMKLLLPPWVIWGTFCCSLLKPFIFYPCCALESSVEFKKQKTVVSSKCPLHIPQRPWFGDSRVRLRDPQRAAQGRMVPRLPLVPVKVCNFFSLPEANLPGALSLRLLPLLPFPALSGSPGNGSCLGFSQIIFIEQLGSSFPVLIPSPFPVDLRQANSSGR